MDIIVVLLLLSYTIYASWHGNVVQAAEWNAQQMEGAVWVLLAVFFLWLLHGIQDIQKPVTVFIWIVVIAIAVMQYKTVSGNITQAWQGLTSKAPANSSTVVTGAGE